MYKYQLPPTKVLTRKTTHILTRNGEVVFKEVDLLSSLLTGPEAKEIVLFGEDDPTFDIALATIRNNSWDGIHYGELHVQKFEEKKLKSVELCSQMGRKHGLTESDILKRIQDLLKTHSPPSQIQGKVVWFQYTLGERGPKIAEAIEEMKDKQQNGDYLLFGVCSGRDHDYGLSNINKMPMKHLNREYDFEYNGGRNYEFIGCDTKLIKELVLYGYTDYSSLGNKHYENAILVFQKIDNEKRTL